MLRFFTLTFFSVLITATTFAYQEQVYFGKSRMSLGARDKCVGAMLYRAEEVTAQPLTKISSAYGEIGLGQYTYFCADFADGSQCECRHKIFSGISNFSCRQPTDVKDSCLDNINTELRIADLPPVGGRSNKSRKR